MERSRRTNLGLTESKTGTQSSQAISIIGILGLNCRPLRMMNMLRFHTEEDSLLISSISALTLLLRFVLCYVSFIYPVKIPMSPLLSIDGL